MDDLHLELGRLGLLPCEMHILHVCLKPVVIFVRLMVVALMAVGFFGVVVVVFFLMVVCLLCVLVTFFGMVMGIAGGEAEAQ